MKKLLALLIIFGAILSVSVSSATAEDFDATDYVHPFSGYTYTEDSFDGSGEIAIILHHKDSIHWREYTFEDFPGLELESVEARPPMSDDQEFIESNWEYRNFVYIVLKDKSNEAVIKAIQHICDLKKYYYASPTPYEFKMGDANRDREINLNDVSSILKYIAGWELDKFESVFADVSYDQIVDLKDAAYLLKHLAGWDAPLEWW